MTTTNTFTIQKDRKRLYEISVIRPLIILSLVLNHAFVKIAVGGIRTNDYHLPDLYNWINYFNFEATLEFFVLISGYLFAFQCITLKRDYTFKDYTLKKARRLLLPMLVFGIIYYFLFFYNPDSFGIRDFLIILMNGCGHLWFLPMLFWCLMALWVFERLHLDVFLTLIGLAIVSFISYLPLPFGFSTVPHYLFYAFLGYYIYKHKDSILGLLTVRWWILPVLWLLYIVFVWLAHYELLSSFTIDSLLSKVLLYGARGSISLLACLCGILAMYGTIASITSSNTFELSPLIQKADKVSFGIYIYHQFLLVALYHYTPIVHYINAWLLPWTGFIIALFFSWVLTSLTLRTRWGKFLIG